MGLGEVVRSAWSRVTGVEAAAKDAGERKTVVAPAGWGSIFTPLGAVGVRNVMPKPTAVNLRRFAETPVARRAINCIKDRIACMDWQIVARQDLGANGPRAVADRNRRAESLRRALEAPNEGDSFRTLIEAVIEDVLVGGFGAAEIETTGEAALPVRLYPVDGASIQVNAEWRGDASQPRYAQVSWQPGKDAVTQLLDSELMYVRLNPRTYTPFGLGKLEVAFESISQFLQAHRFAGRMASNTVMQYALWLNERTPEQHERLIRWWQDEVEGSGKVPILSSEQKPEVLKFAAGTDADLHLEWQTFLLTMIANAFDLPPMMLGVTGDVNKSTASELADEAFQNAVVPLAKSIAEHITRDVIAKGLGWDDLRFVWNGLESRNELVEAQIQTMMLNAGVLTVAEVRAMRGIDEAGIRE